MLIGPGVIFRPKSSQVRTLVGANSTKKYGNFRPSFYGCIEYMPLLCPVSSITYLLKNGPSMKMDPVDIRRFESRRTFRGRNNIQRQTAETLPAIILFRISHLFASALFIITRTYHILIDLKFNSCRGVFDNEIICQ